MIDDRRLPDRISIIVPCYNEVDGIGDLLEALAGQTYPLDRLEVIIADGMSSDGTRDRIQSFQRENPHLSILIVDNPARIIPAALNVAIQSASGEIIIRLDAHSIPRPDYIARCVEVLEDQNVANVGGIWEIEPGSGSHVARGIAAAAAHPLGAGGARYRVGGPPGPVDTVPFGAFRRSWLDRVGQFNEALLSNEDYEYNVRLREAGGVVFFDPRIRSVYIARSTLPALGRQYARYGYWKARMLRRYPGTMRLRQLIPPVFVGSLLVLALLSPILPLAAALLKVELGIYALFAIVSAFLEVWRRKDPSLVFTFPLALIVIHFSWGIGFWNGLIRSLWEGGHGPR
ncbi:MAG: glycosyltransferase family 2 protein [Anaerolineales bacterium]|jgi:glycosyltransferase involved in cell wall biosynthesis